MLRGKKQDPLLPFMGLALLIHMAAVPLVPLLAGSPSPSPKRRVRVLTLKTTRSAKPTARKPKEAARTLTPKPVKKKKPPKKEHDRDWTKKKQVFLPPSLEEVAPEKSRFVSEFNSKTKRETISRHATFQPENVLNERSVAKKQARPSTDSSKASPAVSLQPASPAAPSKPSGPKKLEIPNLRLNERLALRFNNDSGLLKNKRGQKKMVGNSFRLRIPSAAAPVDASEANEGRQAPVKGASKNLNLVPNLGVLARLSGGPDLQLLDQDIEEGEGTFLNSSSFKYGGFFRRVRQRIGTFWNPVRELHRRDPTGNVFGRRDRITVVTLTLDRIGNVQEAFVSSTSGLDFLDQAAVGALHRARQFPNLPEDLLSAQNTFTFSFRFHVVRSGRGGRRIPF